MICADGFGRVAFDVVAFAAGKIELERRLGQTPLVVRSGKRDAQLRGLSTNELCSHVLAKAPDHSVCAVPGGAVAGEEQHEFVGNVESEAIDPHPAVGNIGNEAVARRIASSGLDLRQTFERVTRRSAFFLSLRRGHDKWPPRLRPRRKERRLPLSMKPLR